MELTIFPHSRFLEHVHQSPGIYSFYETAAGKLVVFATAQGIFHAQFETEIVEIPPHYTYSPSIPQCLLLCGTEFQIKVWQTTLNIPAGKTVSYSDIAHSIGKPQAVRAVARALGQNKIAYFIPCHRVIGKNGSMTGYKWSIDIKKQLLAAEQS